MKHYFLRNVLCVSIALSLLMTSVQLPLRQAEAFVPVAIPAAGAAATANTATWVPVVNTLVMIGIASSKADQKKCAQTFPNNSKAQFCIPPKNGTLEVLIAHAVTYAHVVCPGLKQSCLQKLQEKANPFLRYLENKIAKKTVNFKSLCPVLTTLFEMQIFEYCKANGYDVPNPTPKGSGTVPPKKGGGDRKTGSMGILPFLQQIISRVNAAVQDALRNCPPWLKKIVPFLCGEKEVSKPTTTKPTAQPTIQPTTKPTATPTVQPTTKPTAQPTTKPTATPTVQPTTKPTAQPTTKPTAQPTVTPTATLTSEKFDRFADAWDSLLHKRAQKRKPEQPITNEDILYETFLALNEVAKKELQKSTNSRDTTAYKVLQYLFNYYSYENKGTLMEKKLKYSPHLEYWFDIFTMPQKFRDYEYNDETTRRFLLILLGKSEKDIDSQLSEAIETFENITFLEHKLEVEHPLFWRFKDLKRNYPSRKTKK